MTNQHERELLARISAEPGKMGGKPVIRGRRITPAMVLEDADIDACPLYAPMKQA